MHQVQRFRCECSANCPRQTILSQLGHVIADMWQTQQFCQFTTYLLSPVFTSTTFLCLEKIKLILVAVPELVLGAQKLDCLGLVFLFRDYGKYSSALKSHVTSVHLLGCAQIIAVTVLLKQV